MYPSHREEQNDTAYQHDEDELQHMQSVAVDLGQPFGSPEDTNIPSVYPAAALTDSAAFRQSLDDRRGPLAPSQGTAGVGFNLFDGSEQFLALTEHRGMTGLYQTVTDRDDGLSANRSFQPAFGHPARPYPMQVPLDSSYGSYQSITTQSGRPIDGIWPGSFAAPAHNPASGNQYVGFAPDTKHSQTEASAEAAQMSALTPHASAPRGAHGTLSFHDSNVNTLFSEASYQGLPSTGKTSNPSQRSQETLSTSGRVGTPQRRGRPGKNTDSVLSGKEKKAPGVKTASTTRPINAQLALEQWNSHEWDVLGQQWQQEPIKARIHRILARHAEIMSTNSPNQLVPLARRVCAFIPATWESVDSITTLLVTESTPASMPGMGLQDQNSLEYLVSAVNIISASIVRAQKSAIAPSKESARREENLKSLKGILGDTPVVTFAALPPQVEQGNPRDSLKDYRCDTCKLTAASVCVMPVTLRDWELKRPWLHDPCSRCALDPDSNPKLCTKRALTVGERTVDYKGLARDAKYQHPLLEKLLSTAAGHNVEVQATIEGQPSGASQYFQPS